MSAFVVFDVEIRDPARYQDFMTAVKPALAAAGARYLARGGAHKVYEGDWRPRRIVILEFPSITAWEQFYYGPVYQGVKPFVTNVVLLGSSVSKGYQTKPVGSLDS